MSLWTDITNVFTGGVTGILDKIVDTAVGFFPPSMSDAEKASFELKLRQLVHSEKIEVLKLGLKATEQFNQRTKDLEGTANDLKSIPFVGAIIIFLRGAFRPLFAYTVGYMDFMVLSGKWTMTDPELKSLLWLVNFLVLGFYFGERTLKNVLPLMKGMMKGKGA